MATIIVIVLLGGAINSASPPVRHGSFLSDLRGK